jgi:hypothetical protein
MKLNAAQVKQTLNQIKAQVLPDDHPAMGKLSELFGDHTFFVDESGLKVLESAESGGAEAQTGTVVSLADWNDKTFSSLHAHEPAPTGDVVVLGKLKH